MKKTYIQPKTAVEQIAINAYMVTISGGDGNKFDVITNSDGVTEGDVKDREWEEF